MTALLICLAGKQNGFNPLVQMVWGDKAYLILHPALFFGAIYFRNLVVVKTICSAALVLFVCILWITYHIHLEVLGVNATSAKDSWGIVRAFYYALKDNFVIIYSLFFWVMSYLRFRELDA